MNFKFNRIIYPAILALFISIASAAFLYSMIFFSRSINDIFVINETKIETNKTVDLKNYNFIAPRIGIELDAK